MEKIDWENLSNNEIILKQKVLTNEYEVVKDKIIENYNMLDEMDEEYLKSEKVLNKRIKRKI